MWRLILIAALVGIVVAGLAHYRHTLAENKRLNIELGTANATVGALDEVNRRNNEAYEQERNAVDEIEHAPDSENGPVADVLRRTIERMSNSGQ